MTKLFEEVLDAENEATFEWRMTDRHRAPPSPGSCYIQAVRDSGSTAITINVQACIPEDDGTKHWHQVATFNVDAAAGSTAMVQRDDMIPGCLYRCVYGTAATDDIQILVAGSYLELV